MVPQRRLQDVTPLDWRPLARADLDDLSDLLRAIDHLDDPATRHSPEDLVELFHQAGSDPAHQSVVGHFGDALLAFAWNVSAPSDRDPRRVWLLGGVHPGWRAKGIGRELLAWQIQQARSWYRESRRSDDGPLALIADVDEKLAARRDLYERAGLLPKRWYADMHCRFDEYLPDLGDLGRDVTVVPYAAGYAERARQAHNEAFAELWGAQPVDEVAWLESLSRSTARPEWSWLAVNGDDEVVGYALNSAHPQDWAAQGFSEGWTDRLGVRPEYRGRGIAKALLAASMRSFAGAGLEGAGLGVDSENPTGAVGLYRALGYVSADTVIRYLRVEETRASGKTKKKH